MTSSRPGLNYFEHDMGGTDSAGSSLISAPIGSSDGLLATDHNSMRIAQIAPLAERVPPKLYGGTERVVAWLIDELVELGHDVTLFASGDSRTKGKLHPVWPRALRLGREGVAPNAAQAALLETMGKHAGAFDVIHC